MLVLNLGARSGMLEKIWPKEQKKPRFILVDFSEKIISKAINHATRVGCDEDFLPIAPNFLDSIISCLSLHRTNDLPRALGQITATLKPDSLFLFSISGGQISLNSGRC